MKKRSTKLMALFLAAVMAVTPVSTAYAATDELTTEVAETEVTEEYVTEEDSSEEVAESEEVTTEEVTTEEVTTEEVTTEEVTTEEATTEEITTEDATEEEETETLTEDATEVEEVSETETIDEDIECDNGAGATFPGMGEDYVLTARQEASKKALAESMDDFEDYKEGVHYIAGEIIYSTDSEEEAQEVAEAYGGTLESCFDGVAVIKLSEGVSVASALNAALDTDMKLPAVYPNYYRQEYTTATVETASHRTSDPYLAVDSEYYQWQHYAVGSMYAWNVGYTGAGIKVAVIDSGVQATHPDLKNNVKYSYNAMTGTTSDTDDTSSGHGTHVAGIIAAEDNTIGGRGIAPDAQIYNIRVFGNHEESGSAASIARAVNHAVAQGVDVINMSLGGVGYTYDEYMSVYNAKNAGVAVFVAAGNDGSVTECYPAAFQESICVAAVDKGNGKAVFSNYGSWVDLAGPGVDIYSTYPTTLKSDIGVTGYDIMSGTSQATPVIAGTAAVILSANPKALQNKTGAAKVDALVKLMSTGATKATGGKLGKGVVNLPKVLGISGAAAKPAKPTFDVKAGTIYAEEVTTKVSAAFDCDIYYSTDGKTPTLKNGVVVNGQKAGTNPQSITVNGIVNGKATGKVTVKAIAVNKYTMTASAVASVTYTLKPVVTSVSVTGATTNITAGKSLALKAEVTPLYAANKKVVWSINATKESGVSITNGGVVKTTKTATPGEYTVTATPADGQGGTPGTYKVTVLGAAQVKSIKFTSTSVKLEMKDKGVTYNLANNIVAVKEDGNSASASDFVWTSSKPAVATVNKKTGVVTTVGAGTTTITALAADGSGVKKTCTVTVIQLAKSITITQPVNKTNKDTVHLAAGKSVSLKADVQPATTKNKAVEWSITGDSKETGVSISKAGKVTATKNAKAGSYTVTAKAKDGSETTDTIKVVVYSGITNKLTLDKKNATLFRVATAYKVPTSTTLTVATEGTEGYSASDYTVTSSNENIVTVSKSGNKITVEATGKAIGTSTIKVVANDGSGKSATCKVTVKNPVSNLSIAPEAGRTGDLGEGKSLKLSPIYEEEFGKATKKVTWSVIEGTDVVKVDKNSGKVTALKGLVGNTPGYAVVQAEVADGSGVKATYEIYTYEDIEKIDLYLTWSEEAGAYLANIYYNGLPYKSAGVYPEVNVELSNTAIASVNNSYTYGQFALYVWDYGKVKITVKAMDGSGKKVTKYYNFVPY